MESPSGHSDLMQRYCLVGVARYVRAMRTYVSTLGYHSTRVTRPILRHGLEDGDEIVLVRPLADEAENNERPETEVDDIRRMVREITSEVTVTVEHVTDEDFAQTVRECFDLLQATRGDLIVNFDGGPREVFLPFAIAALVWVDRIDTVLQFRDIDSTVRELRLPRLVTSPQPKSWATLETLPELGGATTLPELTEASEHSKSTITRHLDDLETAGLVESNLDGKTKRVMLTLAGDLRLQARTT